MSSSVQLTMAYLEFLEERDVSAERRVVML